jgi:hypothetical protein
LFVVVVANTPAAAQWLTSDFCVLDPIPPSPIPMRNEATSINKRECGSLGDRAPAPAWEHAPPPRALQITLSNAPRILSGSALLLDWLACLLLLLLPTRRQRGNG